MPDMHAHHHHDGAHVDEPGSPIGFTGERVLPDVPEWAWCFQAHLFGYEDLSARISPDDALLEIGCGEGYGSYRLAQRCRSVVACDVASDAVAHAAAKYRRDNLTYLVSDATSLPYADRSFDVVCSLQVIEHFTDTERHLAEVARVLRDGGWHFVTTPNIDQMGEAEKDNPYHHRDFNAGDLRSSLESHFEEVTLEGMFYVESSPRYRRLREAERKEERLRPRIRKVETFLSSLPGPLRVRMRPALRAAFGVTAWPLPEAEQARNAILAEDFYAATPAEESFCLIGIARRPKRR